MILKSAMSYVLRIKFGITGIVPVDELKNDPSVAHTALAVAPEQLQDVGDAIPEELRETDAGKRLLAAVHAINDVAPTSWPAAKCEMAFPGRSEAELGALATQIEAELATVTAARPARGQPPAAVITIRVKCDVPGCPARFTTDVTHEFGMEFGSYLSARGRSVTLDGRVELPEGWRGDGTVGAGVVEPFRFVCGAHA
jgi:hypothetical protein